MEEAIEKQSQSIGDVSVDIEALLHNRMERGLNQAVRLGLAGRPSRDRPVQKFLPVRNPIDQSRRLHVPDRLDLRSSPTPAAALGVAPALMKLPGEEAVQPLVEVQGERPYEGGVVPGARIGIVSKVGEVEDLGAIFHGAKDLSGEVRVAVLKDSENEHERFEGDDPIAGLADALGDRLGAGGGVELAIGGDELEDVGQVAVVEGDFVMGGGFEDGNLEVDGAAAIGA
ncbi:hypothetical protein TorRG33x02_196920 [Trema orientale]|uniref:Uncharacterized protein n=1 Tax=Trema orientale TaxID=63057 RepID=A0A2P5EG10_TREOI|nr:hypothetical protein TorRG33x02_196920 [Trema orientale]